MLTILIVMGTLLALAMAIGLFMWVGDAETIDEDEIRRVGNGL